MIKKMIDSNRARNRIWFNLKRANLCPLCNNELFFDTKEDIFVCKNEECNYKEDKMISNDDNLNIT